MKANELRIGNYLNLDYPISQGSQLIRVSENTILQIYRYEIAGNNHKFIPIPLTKEWLLKFGFEKKITSDVFPTFFKNKINVNDRVVYVSEYGFLNHIKNVHQLQNLYYALTGEELTII